MGWETRAPWPVLQETPLGLRKKHLDRFFHNIILGKSVHRTRDPTGLPTNDVHVAVSSILYFFALTLKRAVSNFSQNISKRKCDFYWSISASMLGGVRKLYAAILGEVLLHAYYTDEKNSWGYAWSHTPGDPPGTKVDTLTCPSPAGSYSSGPCEASLQ